MTSPIKPDEECTLNVQNFPDLLRREMKAQAAMDGKTLKEALIEAAQLWVEVQHDNAARRGQRGGQYLRAASATGFTKSGDTNNA
jgi:hypothetical protein